MQPFIIHVAINGKTVPFEVDSGAGRSLISLQTFNYLFTPGAKPELDTSNVVLTTWGESAVLRVVGRFNVCVTHKNITKSLSLLVTKEDGPNLLGRNWFQPLEISLEGVHQVMNNPGTTSEDPPNFFSLPAVTGIGTGRYLGPAIHLDLKPGTKPVFQRARQVPFALTTRVDEAIQKNIDNGIWIPIPFAGEWATALVPVIKSNGSVRLCGAYNQTVNRGLGADSYQTNTVDAVLAGLGPHNKVFAELDLVDAYTQCAVDEQTSLLLTVNTPRGLFRVTTLPFGIKCASAAF